jgi:excisionase family DNA binding protein
MNHNTQTPKTFCTTQEAAKLLSVSLRTAQLWVESGLLEAWKTEGGHRRISRQSIDKLLAHSANNQALSQVQEAQAGNPTQQDNPNRELLMLVVEDYPALRRLYEVKVRGWNLPIKVITAADGYEALISIGNNKPDLLVTDLRLPGMNGFKMINAICSMPELSDVKIVVVSGLEVAEIASRGGIPNGIPVLPKPIPFDRLRTIAESLLLKNKEKLSQEQT